MRTSTASSLVSLALFFLSVSASSQHNVPAGAIRRRHAHRHTGHRGNSTGTHVHHASTASASQVASASTSAHSSAATSAAVNDAAAAKAPASNATAGEYSIVDRWAGSTFFDGWDFFTNSDPTHGSVNYLSESAATKAGLAYVDNGVAVMAVDSTSNIARGANRDSVRISSTKRYDGGLFVLDVESMPYGCGVWPAFWTVGQEWPNHGEIDIVEGVHNNVQNQATLHTGAGCTTDTSSTAPADFNIKSLISTATVTNTQCASGKTDNTGCAFIDSSKQSYGKPLNAAGGAVFAMLWTDDGIKIWNFPRDSVPADLASQDPSPSNWDNSFLKAAWGASTCPTASHFKQHAITFDITLGGDWGAATYASAGCPGTLATQLMTGSNFKTAQWRVNSVSVYQ